MSVQIVFDIAVIAGLLWFWSRRTRPVLAAIGAEPLARRLALAATVVAIAAVGLHLLAVVTGIGEAVASWIRIAGGLVWIVVVGLGHPQYRFLRHATGSGRSRD